LSFYPKDAAVPAELRTNEFVLRPLRVSHLELDYAAVMASKEMLRCWSSSQWPRDNFTMADNRKDLEWHQREHEEGIAFTYTVLNPAETECLGCVYVKENNVAALSPGPHQAIVRFWVKAPRLDDDLDQRLLQALRTWFEEEWAFDQVWFHTNEQDEPQVRLLDASDLSRQATATIPGRNGTYIFYG
jgi:hypothetical protein